MPSAIASLISGFGYGQVGKFPSGRDIGVAHLLQGAGHRLQTGAVQWAVNNSHILVDFFAKQDRLILDLIYKGSVDLIRNILDIAICKTSLKIAVLYIRKDIQLFDFSQNFGSCLGRNLAAIRPRRRPYSRCICWGYGKR